MPSSPKNYPFYNWVPKPVGIIILFVFFLPILTVGGTYSVASTEMMSGLGIISEHIQFANFATSIGMAAFCPFLYRLVVIRRQKMMCLAGFSLMYIFSYICAKTDSVFLLALCSIFMGFLRMVLMMVNLFTLIKYAGHIEAYDKITPGNEPVTGEGWDKLDIERSAAQPAIYLFFMVLGQLGTSLTAWLAFEYEWQYIHYFMMGLLLLCILITFITMPYHKYTTRRFPINLSSWQCPSSASHWLALPTCLLMAKCSTGTTTQPYDGPQSAPSLLVVYSSTSSLPNAILTINSMYSNCAPSVWVPILFSVNGTEFQRHVCQRIHRHRHETGQLSERHPRQLVHAGLPHRRYSTIWLSVKGVHFKYLFAAGFLLLGLSTMFMYFEVQGAGLYERMKYPVIIRSTGMMFLYSLIPTYATQRMPYKYLSSWICTMPYRTHGIGSQHRSRTLYECTARTPAALRHPLCTECRHATPRSVRLVYPKLYKVCNIRERANKKQSTWLPYPPKDASKYKPLSLL